MARPSLTARERPRLSGAAASRRELSRLELAACVLVILALAVAVLHYTSRLMAVAEEHRLSATVNELRTALMLAAAARLVRGDGPGIARLAAANPLVAVARQPRYYDGERADRDAAEVPGGRWFFDPEAALLVYRVEHASRFHSALPGPSRARFRVALRWRDGDGDGAPEASADRFEGIDLRPVEPYAWGDPTVGAGPAPVAGRVRR